MRVEVTAMKNFPSNLGSLLLRARSRARVSKEGPMLMGIFTIRSRRCIDWPFSDIESLRSDCASGTGECSPLDERNCLCESWAGWIARGMFVIILAHLINQEDDHDVAKHPLDSCGRHLGRAGFVDGSCCRDLRCYHPAGAWRWRRSQRYQ